MRINYSLIFLIILLSGISKGYAQNCSTLGQNPLSSFPVCGTATFVQNSVPLCDGTDLPGPCGAGFPDRNPFWYHFTCYIGGTLGFQIRPNNLADDYDWQLFDVTGRNPNDVYTDASLFLACNWSGLTGITGASNAGTSLINCAGNTFPIFSSMPTLIAGHDYLLMISHYTFTSQSGYKLTFTMNQAGGGTAGITDPNNPFPKMTSATASCDGTQVIVHFNKTVKCSSLALDGSDFIISPAAPITSVLGYGCSTSFELDSVALLFSSPLPPANYTVTAANGIDGNTLLDNCDIGIAIGNDATFTVDPRPALPMGTIVQPTCAPIAITLTFADPIKCNSVAANGSDFSISGPSVVTITSAAAANCNANGETNTINIQLSGPILTGGNYQLKVVTGADGNTLIGQCSRQVANSSTAPFDIAVQPPLPMGTVTPPACTPSSVTVTFADAINCNSIAANGSDFIITGPSAVTIISATAVNCTGNGETNAIIIQFATPILLTGTYQVQIVTGIDGNTLVGNCLRQIIVGNTAAFTLAAQTPIAMGTITPPSCVPQSLTLTFADPIKCSSIAANGSDFVVTGPSAVIVTSATAVNCVNDETNTITIQFSTPVLVTGNYQVQVATGSDGNTLIGQCGRQVNAGGSSAFVLAPQPPLPMGTITQPSCSPSSIALNFPSTAVLNCSSATANGSDFIITGPSPVTIISASATCNTNPAFPSVITLQLSAPITTSGIYQLQVVTGTDGNTITGICNSNITPGDFTTFTIPDAPPVPMGSLSPIACSPSSLRLTFASPLRCSSIAANGSDFTITGPSPIIISAAAGTCDANGLTTTIDIQLSSPVVAGGTYQLQLVAGSDGNTLLSECNRQTPAGGAVSFTASDTVSAEFQYQVQYDCLMDAITFSHDGQHNVNQWTWTVNGVAASSSQTFSQSFSAASQNQVQLVVSNGVCSDTYSTSIVLNNKVTVAFTAPETVCPNDTAIFINQSKGPIDTWQWNFGNGNTSADQSPPAQTYPVTGIETLYTLSLIGSNANGCQQTATQIVKVLSNCIIAVPTAFTPNNDGLNDYLYPLNALKAENLDFKVFNRWGQLIFHSTDWRQKWDGRINGIPQATNVYIWTLDFTLKDTKQKYSLKGTSTLIR